MDISRRHHGRKQWPGRSDGAAVSAQDATVVLGARRVDCLQSLADELTSRGGKALARVTDITDHDQVKPLVDSARG